MTLSSSKRKPLDLDRERERESLIYCFLESLCQRRIDRFADDQITQIKICSCPRKEGNDYPDNQQLTKKADLIAKTLLKCVFDQFQQEELNKDLIFLGSVFALEISFDYQCLPKIIFRVNVWLHGGCQYILFVNIK